ncbi:hypothetical protein SEVIR_9G357200v4 [Setaria viridis]|uniref:Uncharacterized protein n=1 Tax=Setaria italica TaxID=4555 RepID=K4AEC8_SETIT
MPGAEQAGMRRPTESERRRMYRDLALSLRCGLRDAAAGFSFLRLRGLRGLLRALHSADADLGLFRDSQAIRDLQVVPVLFEHSLRKATGDAVVTVAQVLGMEPAAARLRNPATDSEVVLALRVLQGCCLLCPGCAAAAHRYNAVKDFKEQFGLNKIADIVKDPNRDDHVRLKCSEFLLLYSGNCGATFKSNIQEDLKKLFGEKCASFICSTNLFSSTLDSQVRQCELSFLAEQVLDYMQPY